ncbi:MAG: PaaI family thioesterase [Bacteroidetes bacterium]|nr:MAG: PaaI family thioesterase [Bacteroidota bacterium]RLD48889.1 MAG: PaaI family thioesterase [Bacteroidota bacterium]RLD86819.1 MAG: PaaI family thioesterase [Bacteroidota bacterium]
MRKILNPYVHVEGYNCFACSPNNENGLQMQFVEDGDYVTCEWEPRGFLQGYNNILHGGIQATLLDEIASWFVQIKLKTAGVTSSMNIRLRRTVYVNKGNLKLRAWLKETRRNLVDVYVELINPDGKVGAEGVITYFTFSPETAREKLNYPKPEEFFEQKE